MYVMCVPVWSVITRAAAAAAVAVVVTAAADVITVRNSQEFLYFILHTGVLFTETNGIVIRLV